MPRSRETPRYTSTSITTTQPTPRARFFLHGVWHDVTAKGIAITGTRPKRHTLGGYISACYAAEPRGCDECRIDAAFHRAMPWEAAGIELGWRTCSRMTSLGASLEGGFVLGVADERGVFRLRKLAQRWDERGHWDVDPEARKAANELLRGGGAG